MTIDEQKLLREHYEIMADIKSIKKDILDGEANQEELLRKIEALEKKAQLNDVEHLQFVRNEAIAGIRDSLKKLEDGMIVMTPKQAKDAGSNWFSIMLKNPQYLMWIILGVVILSMVIMGYSYVEISQVLDRLK